MSRIGCIIQGNARYGLMDVINQVARHFNPVIFSTWKSEEPNVPAGKFELVLNDPPPNNGITNRNLQRVSTIAGVKCAQALDCEYVMKWRTDMLPTALDLDELLQAVNYNVPSDVPSRLLMPAFRNLSVIPDWFSSFPDMYAFGHIDMMKLLWDHGNFDFSRPYNVPQAMLEYQGLEITDDDKLLLKGNDVTDDYDAHIEFYAFFKEALQNHLKREIVHPEIARDYLYPMDHNRLKICWFRSGQKLAFRSIAQAFHLPWLTEKKWHSGEMPQPIEFSKQHGTKPNFLQKTYGLFKIKAAMWRQKHWLNSFKKHSRSI